MLLFCINLHVLEFFLSHCYCAYKCTRIFSISLFLKAARVTREDEISKSNHSNAPDKSGYSRESHSRSRYTGRPGKDMGQSGPVVIKHDLKLTLIFLLQVLVCTLL